MAFQNPLGQLGLARLEMGPHDPVGGQKRAGVHRAPGDSACCLAAASFHFTAMISMECCPVLPGKAAGRQTSFLWCELKTAASVWSRLYWLKPREREAHGSGNQDHLAPKLQPGGDAGWLATDAGVKRLPVYRGISSCIPAGVHRACRPAEQQEDGLQLWVLLRRSPS